MGYPTGTTFEAVAGVPHGYYARVLGPKKPKRLSIDSLLWAIEALGLKAVVIEDPAALKRVEAQYVKRDGPHTTAGLADKAR